MLKNVSRPFYTKGWQNKMSKLSHRRLDMNIVKCLAQYKIKYVNVSSPVHGISVYTYLVSSYRCIHCSRGYSFRIRSTAGNQCIVLWEIYFE